MKATVREALLWPIVSLCVVVAVVFGVMLDNADKVAFTDILRSLAVLGFLAVLTNLALMALSPVIGRVFPVAVYAAFAFSDIRNGLDFGYGTVLAYWAVLALPLAAGIVLRRIDRAHGLSFALAIAGSMAVATVAFTGPRLHYAPAPTIDEDFRKGVLALGALPRDARAELPDIIYVVPDRYPSSETLRRVFQVDNDAFYSALRARGFVVEQNANANYPRTFQSLASTLNGGYLDSFTATYGHESDDQRPIYDAIENNVVQEHLRRLGYEFHNYGNWWGPTRINRWADVNYQGYRPGDLQAHLSAFERVLLRMSPTLDIVRWFADEYETSECRRIQRKFDRLSEVGDGTAPLFVFAHMLVPHPPITMDASGRCLDRPVRDYEAAFADYLRYFNAAVLKVIDRQVARRKGGGRRVVFAIQSEEGPWARLKREGRHDFNAMTRAEVRMKMGIVNALRLPAGMGVDQSALASPVNNWRILFGELFGTEMSMLPHRSFIYESRGNVYRFCEVTDLVSRDAVDGMDAAGRAHEPGPGEAVAERTAQGPLCSTALGQNRNSI